MDAEPDHPTSVAPATRHVAPAAATIGTATPSDAGADHRAVARRHVPTSSADTHGQRRRRRRRRGRGPRWRRSPPARARARPRGGGATSGCPRHSRSAIRGASRLKYQNPSGATPNRIPSGMSSRGTADRLGRGRRGRVDDRVAGLLQDRRERVAMIRCSTSFGACLERLDRVEDRRRVEHRLRDERPRSAGCRGSARTAPTAASPGRVKTTSSTIDQRQLEPAPARRDAGEQRRRARRAGSARG